MRVKSTLANTHTKMSDVMSFLRSSWTMHCLECLSVLVHVAVGLGEDKVMLRGFHPFEREFKLIDSDT
jgi:hypothetical protein